MADFDFVCPFCNEGLSVAEENEEAICKCPSCGNEIVPTKVSVAALAEKEEAEAREKKALMEEQAKIKLKKEKQQHLSGKKKRSVLGEKAKRVKEANLSALKNSFYDSIPSVSGDTL